MINLGTFNGLIDAALKLLLIAAVLAGGWLVYKRSRAKWTERNRRAARYSQEYASLMSLSAQQGAAIDMVIVLLADEDATYATFPPEISAALYAAHDRAREVERKGS